MSVSNTTNLVSITDDIWKTNLCAGLDALRSEGNGDKRDDFCDVTLTTTDGACMRVHSCVLAAASPYLRALLAGTVSDCVLRLEAVSSPVLRALVAFIYGGAVCLPVVELQDVVAAATQLGVHRLVELGTQACSECAIYGGSEEAAVDTIKQEHDVDVPETATEQAHTEMLHDAESGVVNDTKQDITHVHNEFTTNSSSHEIEQYSDMVMSPLPPCDNLLSNHPTSRSDVELDVKEDRTSDVALAVVDDGERLYSVSAEQPEVEGGSVACEEITDEKGLQLIHGSGGQPVYVKIDLNNVYAGGQEDTVVELPTIDPDKSGLFSCDDCGRQFKKRLYLEEHRRSHTGDLYTCNVCSKQFQWRRGLELHMRTHTGEKPYGCDVCGHRFAHSSNYSAHMRRHKQARPFACSTCDERFGSRSSLARHRRVHKSDDSRPSFACDVCERAFAERHLLTKHMFTHTGERTYKCKVCARCFTHASSLSYHRWTHKRERPFACEKCGKGYVTREQLNSHMHTHTGERPYECTYCARRFASAANRTVHMRTHTGERPYACLACSRCFSTSSNLVRHREWHARRAAIEQADIAAGADQKPFQCSACGKRFAQHATLMSHEKVHQMPHTEFKCADCDVAFSRVSNLRRHQRTTGHAAPVDLTLTDTHSCDTCGHM